MLSKSRVVITGIGLVTPLGCGVENVWRRLLDGYSGIAPIKEFEVPKGCSVSLAGMVPRGTDIDAGEYDPAHDSKHVSRFISYAIHASDLALKSAKIISVADIMDPTRAGVAIGNGGIGSLIDITESHDATKQSYKKLSPYFVPKVLTNMASGHVSMRHGLKGCVQSCTTACAAGTHSIGDAYNLIKLGYFDMMLCGGSDAIVDPLSIAGFARMKALSTATDPKTASRPFDSARNGFIMGEGAGILVLESLDSALARGAPIVAEVLGYGMSADAHHPTAPSADGDGARRCMQMALDRAKVDPADVGYINCHATSTPLGDAVELQAIRGVFGSRKRSNSDNQLYVSATKGATGHLLGKRTCCMFIP